MPASEPPFPAPAPARRAVVVLGMHRSGTSAVAGCLQRLGVDFGPRLMPPTPDNPRGYFEHVDMVNLHDRLLLSLDSSWDETRPLPPGWPDAPPAARYRDEMLALLRRDFPAAPLWGLKDPRLCRLLPWWEPLWTATGTRPLFALVRRPPGEVAASLARREGFSLEKGLRLWLQHVLAAEQTTRGHARVLVDFHECLNDWRTALEPIRTALGQPWPDPAVSPEPFVDRALSRFGEAGSPTLPPLLARADAAFQAGIMGREEEMRAGFDETSVRLDAGESFPAPPAPAEAADLRLQLAAIRRQARWYEAEWQKARLRAARAEERANARKAEATRLKARFLTHTN